MAVATNERKQSGVGQFLREATSEVRKVVWPSREETQRLTIAVIIIALSIGVFLGIFDYLFAQIVSLIQQ